MRGTLQIALLFLVVTAVAQATNFALDSCSLSCNEGENQIHATPNTDVQGRPGKRGAVGQKGDPGVKGNGGDRGPPGESCLCPNHEALATQVAALQEQIKVLKGRVRYPPTDWTKASNGLYYKYFTEAVNYNTAQSRCASFGGRLAAAGMRTAVLRSAIKQLPPNPMPTGLIIWIGLDDLVRQGSYVWSDGVKSTSANTDWGRYEPNNPNERCGALYGPYNGQVVDIGCIGAFHYICEM